MDPTVNRSPEPTDDDYLLEDLAALTGVLNPERIWQEEEALDSLNPAEEEPAPPTPAE
ncbi:MAG: hypothetical protein JWR44_3019 [Hymenobacter sp.]|jgi:hypothetical protein|nr:hypothetical protein [Hymenobacter sp.]